MSLSIASPVDIVETAPSGTARLAPQLIWPTMVLGESGYVDADLGCFPDDDMFRERRKRGMGGAVSASFRTAVRMARERIWLVDEYLLDCDESAARLSELFLQRAPPISGWQPLPRRA